MLILMRRLAERVMIGDEIVITVMDIDGNRVSLGIDAPKDAPVHREEVYNAIQEKLQASTPRPRKRNKG